MPATVIPFPIKPLPCLHPETRALLQHALGPDDFAYLEGLGKEWGAEAVEVAIAIIGSYIDERRKRQVEINMGVC